MDQKCIMLLSLPEESVLLPRLLLDALIAVLLGFTVFGVLDANAIILNGAQESIITVKSPCDGPVINAELVVKNLAGSIIK